MNLLKIHFAAGLLAVFVSGAGRFMAAAEENPRASRDFSAFRIISERNIFDPNRRARVDSGPAPTIVDSFSLTGTMDYAKGKFAVFDGTSSDYHKVLETGGRIAGYTVTEIGSDTVKLSSGTNTLELKVGMQMRRDDNGHWSAGEPATPSESSYASNSPRNESGRRRFSSDSSRAALRSAPRAVSSSNQPVSDQTSGLEAGPAPASSSPGNMDPNDPVARMMARRMQETGGNENGNDNRNPNQ